MTNVDQTPGERDQPAGSPCLQGERVTFTGTLASMTHHQACELVEQHGGTPTGHVSRQTTMLVIGEEGWPLESDGRISQKLRYSEELRQAGHELRLVQESEWLHLLGLEERRREVHRLYTPAMLCQLLGVPVGMIRRWERTGLIRAVHTVFRLPYFDFQEVTCARRMTELLAAGVSPRTIQTSLEKLKSTIRDVQRPLAQLDVVVRGSRLLYRDEFGFVESTSGQRCFDFDTAGDGPEDDSTEAALPIESVGISLAAAAESGQPVDWFVEACRLLDDGELDSAIEAFRMFLMERPGDAEANFHLAETLYRQGNRDGALERYYAAVETEHDYIEAWTQLGCLLADAEQHDAALEALDIALSIHPDYPDAHLHKAEILHQTGDVCRAVPHWRAYLEFDSRGPWAEQARQALEMSSESGISDEG